MPEGRASEAQRKPDAAAVAKRDLRPESLATGASEVSARWQVIIARYRPGWLPEKTEILSRQLFEFLRSPAGEELFKEDDSEKIIRGLLPLCQRALPLACSQLHSHLSTRVHEKYHGIDDLPDGEERDRLLAARDLEELGNAAIAADACLRGNANICDFGLNQFGEPLLDRMKTYCRSGLYDYCRAIGQHLTRSSTDEAAEFLHMGCREEPGLACEELMSGREFDDQDPRKKAAFTIYEDLCAQGKEGNYYPEPCETLAHVAENRGDLATAIGYAERSCELGNADGCMVSVELGLQSGEARAELARTIETFCALTIARQSHREKNVEICRDVLAADAIDAALWLRLEEIEYHGRYGLRRLSGEPSLRRIPASE